MKVHHAVDKLIGQKPVNMHLLIIQQVKLGLAAAGNVDKEHIMP